MRERHRGKDNMKINVTGKNLEITSAIRSHIEDEV